jgi:hypothetical protein
LLRNWNFYNCFFSAGFSLDTVIAFHTLYWDKLLSPKGFNTLYGDKPLFWPFLQTELDRWVYSTIGFLKRISYRQLEVTGED